MVTWGGNALSTFAQEEEIRIEQKFFFGKTFTVDFEGQKYDHRQTLCLFTITAEM